MLKKVISVLLVLTLALCSLPLISGTRVYAAAAGTGYYKITASSLNVRKGAGTDYAKVKSLSKGAVVNVTKVSSNWGQISSGWICLDYASKTTLEEASKANIINGKTGIGMAEWALKAYNEKWSYSYGGSKAGAVDCSGLIRSYCNGKGGGAADLLEASTVNGPISSLPRIHGLALWTSGHVGVYVGKDSTGDDIVVDARNKDKDMCKGSVLHASWSPWVKWFKINMVEYPTTGWFTFNGKKFYYENGEFVVGKHVVDGKEYDFGKDGALVSDTGVSVSTTTTSAPTTTTRPTTTTTKPATTTTTAAAQKVTITGSTVNVRKGAGTSYAKVTTVKKGATYTYTETKTVSGVVWYHISSGWISGDYAKVTGTATTTKATTTTTKATTKATTAAANKLTITGSTVNVRKGAGTSYAKVTSVKKGATYTFTETKTVSGVVWYHIPSGWISGAYAKVTSTAATTKATTKATTAAAKKITITGSTVNVRKGAGTSYAKVTTVKKGATYTYTETKTVSGVVWYHISSGWISGDYAKKA